MTRAGRLAAAIVLAACAGCTGSGTDTASGCVEDVLAAYRSVDAPEAKGFAGRVRQLASDYADATKDAAGVARECAGDVVDEDCRAALEELGTALRDAGGSVVRGARSEGIDGATEGFEEDRARLEGAAAATAACGS